MGRFDLFKEKQEKSSADFQLVGNGRWMKNDEEMLAFNKEEADQAFKVCKREILDVYLKENGFIKYKTNAYIRLSKNDLLEYINIQKEAHGSRTFTLNIAAIPFYVPHDYITLGFGNRLGCFVKNRDFWWDYQNETIAKESFENVVAALEQYVMPWFHKYEDENVFLDTLIHDMYMYGFKFYYLEWIAYMFIKRNDIQGGLTYLNDIKIDDSRMTDFIKKALDILHQVKDSKTCINEVKEHNIIKLKLPKSMFTTKK